MTEQLQQLSPLTETIDQSKLVEQTEDSEVNRIKDVISDISRKVDSLQSEDISGILEIWNNACCYKDLVSEFYSFPDQLANKLLKLREFDWLLTFTETSVMILLNVLGENHEATLNMNNRLAEALMLNGKYESALVKLTDICDKQLDTKHSDLQIMGGYLLSRVLTKLKRFDESLTWAEKTHYLAKKHYGKHHYTYLTTKHQLANKLADIERYHEAEIHYQKLLNYYINTNHNNKTVMIELIRKNLSIMYSQKTNIWYEWIKIGLKKLRSILP